jgi:hypothetical protein
MPDTDTASTYPNGNPLEFPTSWMTATVYLTRLGLRVPTWLVPIAGPRHDIWPSFGPWSSDKPLPLTFKSGPLPHPFSYPHEKMISPQATDHQYGEAYLVLNDPKLSHYIRLLGYTGDFRQTMDVRLTAPGCLEFRLRDLQSDTRKIYMSGPDIDSPALHPHWLRKKQVRQSMIDFIKELVASPSPLYWTYADTPPNITIQAATQPATKENTMPSKYTQQIVECEFVKGGKKYAYFAGDLDLEVGDYALVASPYGDRDRTNTTGSGIKDEDAGGFLKVVRVKKVDVNADGVRRAAKDIICKIDIAEHIERQKRVQEIEALETRIELAANEARKRLELEALVKLSPDLAELLRQRDELKA